MPRLPKLFRGLILGHVLFCLTCFLGFSQDAPQPQPAPGLGNQQVKPTAPVAPQQTPPPTPASTDKQPAKVIPAAAERHFHEAMVFEHDGNAANAIEEYKAAIKEYPDYFEAHYNLGRLYLDRQGYAEAIAELQTAVKVRPDDANAHNNLGLALKHNRDINGALAQYQQAVRLNPKLSSAQNNLANVLYMKRDFNGAIEHYRAALALQGKGKLTDAERASLADTHMNLGSVLDDAGHPDEAIAEYKEALSLQPRDAKAHYNLSIVYQKRKDMTSAISELRIAAKLAPDWPTPHIMLARLLKDSDPKQALDQCIIADGLTEDAKLHNLCGELQKKTQ